MSEEEKKAKTLINQTTKEYFNEILKYDVDKLIDYVLEKELINNVGKYIENIILSDKLILEEEKKYYLEIIKKYKEIYIQNKLEIIYDELKKNFNKEYFSYLKSNQEELKKIYLILMSVKGKNEAAKNHMIIFIKNKYFQNKQDEKSIEELISHILGRMDIKYKIEDLINDNENEEINLIRFIKESIKIYHDHLLMHTNGKKIDIFHKELNMPDDLKNFKIFIRNSIIFCVNYNSLENSQILKRMFSKKEMSKIYKFILAKKAIKFFDEIIPYLNEERYMFGELAENITSYNEILEINNNYTDYL